MRRVLSPVLPVMMLLALAGCEDQYKPVNLYMAATPACRDWSDGSRFDLPEGVRVFASVPAMPGPGPTQELSVAYFVPRGGDVKFSSRDFNLILPLPHGAVVARGVITSVDIRVHGNANPKADNNAERLEQLPLLLRSAASVEETMFRVNLRFKGPLPERFDFTPPPMLFNGKSYPVRTFTYRYFPEKATFGLCV